MAAYVTVDAEYVDWGCCSFGITPGCLQLDSPRSRHLMNAKDLRLLLLDSYGDESDLDVGKKCG